MMCNSGSTRSRAMSQSKILLYVALVVALGAQRGDARHHHQHQHQQHQSHHGLHGLSALNGWFRRLRGGSSNGPGGPPSDHDDQRYTNARGNPNYGNGMPPHDLPYGDDGDDHDAPHYSNDMGPPPLPQYGQQQPQQQHPQQHHGGYSQQQPPPHPQSSQSQSQYYDSPPPPPPGSYDQHGMMYDDDAPPPPHHHHDQPPFPPTSQMDEDAAASSGMDWAENAGSTKDAAMDMTDFDKEYILKGLAKLYKKKILPLEKSSKYGHFHSPPLSSSDFVAPPMVLLLGQYSVGKTSFIRYLIGRDFPGIRVGPEPTTDRFTSVLWGHSDKIVPGAALCSQLDRPFTGLGPFGNNFLSRFEGVELDMPILHNITLVDTPGILSGQKQRSRNYDYDGVMKWFGERADLVVIMFDANKLDISDELKRVMELFIPHLDKVRIVLNKADSISTQQLMRVYGALMWSLGKVMNTPEVCRVYMGSFWDAPLQCTEQAELLQNEEMDLLQDVMRLPQQAVMRRINELVKRARSVKVHAYIIHYLRKQLPYTFGRKEKQRRLIGRLESEFTAAARRYGLPKGDFPPIGPFKQALLEIKDLSEFPKLDKKLVKEMDRVFSVDIPELLEKAKNH